MSLSGPKTRAVLVTAFDALAIASASAAAVILLGGRTRVHLIGHLVSVRSPWNLVIVAAAASFARVVAGGRMRLLPGIPPPPPFLDDERARIERPARWDRRTRLYAAAAVAGSTIWILPQIVHLRSVPDPGDPIFSAWRIAALAHQMATDPRHLWNGNIFYPLPYTITWSDSLFLQSLLGAPFLLSGADPLVVANVLMVVSYPARGFAFFLLAWRMTGDPQAALVAALLGAWSPFYPDHYSQLELQWTMFVPLVLLALMRALARPGWRTGLLFGTAFALQCLACMYVSAMLATFLVPFTLLLALAWRVRVSRALVSAALAASLVVVPVAGGLGAAYLKARDMHGDRTLHEVSDGSAAPWDYGAASHRLVSYTWQSRRSHHVERELFPGSSTIVLGSAGLLPPLTPVTIATIASGALVFDLSLGLKGLLFDDLYKRSAAYRGMRVISRFSAMVDAALVLLAAYGARRLLRLAGRPRARAVACVLVSAAVLVDLRMDAGLQPYLPDAPPVYRAMTSSMVLADMPEGHILDTMYFSTSHWPRLLDGYSGFFPDAPELDRAKHEFPAATSVSRLRALGATHIVYTCAFEKDPRRCALVLTQLAANPTLDVVSRGDWQGEPVVLYQLR